MAYSVQSTAPVRSMDADLLKAIAIVAVVFIHGALIIPTYTKFIAWIFLSLRFCVPIFIFLWAYFTEKSFIKSNNKKAYLFNRFRHLFIPFFFWSLVYFMIIANYSNLTFNKFLTSHWLGFGWSGQYYFIILFQLIAIFAIIRLVGHRLYENTILVILFSIVFYSLITYSHLFDIEIIGKINDRPFFYWLPYALLGTIYSHTGVPKPLVLPLPFIFLALFIVPVEVFAFHPAIISHSPYILPSTFISTIIIIHSVMGKKIEIVITWKYLRSLISLLSRNTLGIFCLNPLIVISLSYLFNSSPYRFDFFGHSIITPIVLTLIIITLCLILTNILKRVKLGILVTN